MWESVNRIERSGGHGGSIASTTKMELGNVDAEGREATNCTNNGGGRGQVNNSEGVRVLMVASSARV